jgi:choline dehydrogenase-like flavoprotein
MIRDLRKVQDTDGFRTEICVIGAGAAGITIARELAEKGHSVILLEGGGREYSEESQRLYHGDVVGHPNTDLEDTRLRFFGGTTNHWTGRCAPFDDLDFKRRPGVRHSGWPITLKDLKPFYARSHHYVDLGTYNYDVEFWEKLTKRPTWKFSGSDLESMLFRFSPPTRFGEKFAPYMEKSDKVIVYLNANLLEVVPAPDNASVSSLVIGTLDGRRWNVEAKSYVLATGGIENARILLNSRRNSENGVANENGLVGRFFMDHLLIRSGKLMVNDEKLNVEAYDSNDPVHGMVGTMALTLSQARRERDNLINVGAALRVKYQGTIFNNQDIEKPGLYALSDVVNALRVGRMPEDLDQKVCRMADDWDAISVSLYRRAARPFMSPSINFFEMDQDAEQFPNPNSRVFLSRKKDALGLNQAALNWEVTKQDVDRLREFHKVMGMELGKIGMGRVKVEIPEGDASEISTAWHHMGTTRMSESPKTGVVNGDCRAHGLANLYIAGSSVFATGGAANPTLTIIALAIRLSDHLHEMNLRA